MFIIQNGKISGQKTLDIGKVRIINLTFKSDLTFADDDKFKLVLGSIQSENYAFVDGGCFRFSYVYVADVIKSQSANFAVQILHNGVQILSDTITITAVIQGGGQIVLPNVTVTADKMLKDITAINTDGAVVTGNIENAVVTTDETDGLTVSVSQGYIETAETKSFSASTITTDQTDGLTVNISKGYVSADQAKNFDSSTVTETDTQVTVSRGWLKEDKTFSVGGGSSEVQGIVYNAFPLRNSTQVKITPSDLTKDTTNFYGMFQNYTALTSIPQLDTSNGTDFSYMFNYCNKLTSIPQLDTSNGTDFGNMFYSCNMLTSIPQLDTSNGTNFYETFYGCRVLTDFGGLLNVKKSFNLSSCTALTHQSLLNVLNGLYDLTGSTSQTLTLGSTNLAKLTDQEIAIATNKNWTLA